jgi:chaperonin GroES
MAKMNIDPLFDNVLIKPVKGEDVLPSGIALPDTAKEKPQMGVKVGDKVMYKKWGGQEIKVQGEEWWIGEQKDILAVVKE